MRFQKPAQKLSKSYVHMPDQNPKFSGLSVGQIFVEKAARVPDKEMYVFCAEQKRKTFNNLLQESQRFAAFLLNQGLRRGDRLGVWGHNHYEWLLVYLAAMQIGVITVHLRMDFPLETQQKILNKLKIRVLILMPSPAELHESASTIIPELSINPAEKLNCESVPSLEFVITSGKDKLVGAYTIDEVMSRDLDTSDVVKTCEQGEMDDILVVTFTSGSTGFPKGVTHTSMSLCKLYQRVPFLFVDVDGNPLPWDTRFGVITSSGGITAQFGALIPILWDGTSIFIAPTYDKHILPKILSDEKITAAALLIHHVTDLLSLPNKSDYDFSSLLVCFTGGSVIPLSLRDGMKTIAKHVLLVFGASEGFRCYQSPTDPVEILTAPAYRPVEGYEFKIVGPDERILPLDTAGEICVRGRSLFLGYWGDEEKTKEAKRPDGWYHTGDLGTMDENGYLRIVGRKSERIIKEGVNLAPTDLEQILDQHPAVKNVMVVGVPDTRTSEEICACIRLHPKTEATEDELKEFCKGKVSKLLEPKYVLFMSEPFPITETGKFIRGKIAEQARTILKL